MFRLWGKIYKNNRLIGNTTVEGESRDDLMDAAEDAIIEICREYDMEKPLWLESNRDEFMRRRKTRFTADNYIDTIDFDYLEIEVLSI